MAWRIPGTRIVRSVLGMFLFVRALRRGWSDPVFRGLALAIAFQLGIGTIFYAAVENWSLLDSLYFCVVASLTVGFGDFAPVTKIGRLFTVPYLLTSVGLYVAFGSRLAAEVIEDHQERRRRFRARRQRPPTSEPSDEP
jgi:hypothetical protein